MPGDESLFSGLIQQVTKYKLLKAKDQRLKEINCVSFTLFVLQLLFFEL